MLSWKSNTYHLLPLGKGTFFFKKREGRAGQRQFPEKARVSNFHQIGAKGIRTNLIVLPIPKNKTQKIMANAESWGSS